MPKSDKSRIRALSRRGSDSGKLQAVESAPQRLREPTLCDRCGATFVHRTWRRDRPVPAARLATARWMICPACRQVELGVGFGRVLASGTFPRLHEDEVCRRIENVAARAAARQPERRVVSIDWDGDTLEILTTSQKLAHRIAHELRKAFGGRTAYHWSDDRTLVARWVQGVRIPRRA